MKRRLWLMVPAALILAAAIYVNDYYRAVNVSMESEGVRVHATDYGWRFDGPSEDAALVFYPGGKVEAAAYVPLMQKLAAAGMDACLVKMPLRLAVFGINAAGRVMAQHDYAHWYVGGHSLGGVMAALYAADHGNALDGVILLAAYPIKPLDDRLRVISLYGSEDGVLNAKQYADHRPFFPSDTVEQVIQGGNHAGFGNYGPQRGDGIATLSPEAQQAEAARIIAGATKGT